MTGVKIREGESFERAFRRFKRLCEKEKIRSEIKKHQRYEKPSEKRQRRAKKTRKYQSY
ncbi:30S ribosomal protein S21 [candidate division WOR-3 bacterium]|nr:30S ribosomal protein S21 [candidate division WOR-3 bacterium]MCK4527705.1 30S ribosomal protein S21 [candidate division WOR-3 bacterium]